MGGQCWSLQPAMAATDGDALINMVAAMMEEELSQLAEKYKLNERLTQDLGAQMKRRQCSFEEDIRSLRERLEAAQDPADGVRIAISEMEEGTFGGGQSQSVMRR